MSKKRSSTSAPLLEPVPTILLDENLSSPDIVQELRRWPEWRVELHKKHFPNPRTPDTEVLSVCGQKGWILVSVDDNMRRVPEHGRAAALNGARAFFFPRHTNGAEYRAALTAGRHKLLKLAGKMPPPNFARISTDGIVGFFAGSKLPKGSSSREKTRAKYPHAELAGSEAV